MKIRSIVGLAAASLLAFQAPSFGGPVFFGSGGAISATTTESSSPSGGSAGIATDYDFTDFGAGPKSLTNFIVTPLTSNTFGGNNDSIQTLTDPSYTTILPPLPAAQNAFQTGIAYDTAAVGNGTPVEFATFSINPASLAGNKTGTFTVSYLDNNTNGNAINASAGLSADGGAQVTGAATYRSGNNELITFTVTGATAADTFQVYTTSATGVADQGAQGAFASLGGLVFNFTAVNGTNGGGGGTPGVPEPTSVVALFGLGAMGLFLLARRKFAA